MEVWIGLYDDRVDNTGNISFIAASRDVAEIHLDLICEGMGEEYRKLFTIKRFNVVTRDDYHIKKIISETENPSKGD